MMKINKLMNGTLLDDDETRYFKIIIDNLNKLEDYSMSADGDEEGNLFEIDDKTKNILDNIFEVLAAFQNP